MDINNSNKIIEKIDELNKTEKVNLIIINLNTTKKMNKQLEEYLIETNKKVLLISTNKPDFDASFIYRQEILDQTFFTYFNNDIQYGAKYIIKRFMDIVLSILALLYFFR